MKKYLIAVIIVMMMCGAAHAEKYELSKEQNQFILTVLANAQIRGADAPMLLQCAQALQKQIVNEVKPPIEGAGG